MSRPSSSPAEQFFGLIFSALATAIACCALARRLYKARKASKAAAAIEQIQRNDPQ